MDATASTSLANVTDPNANPDHSSIQSSGDSGNGTDNGNCNTNESNYVVVDVITSGEASTSTQADCTKLLTDTMLKLIGKVDNIQDQLTTCLQNQSKFSQLLSRVKTLETKFQTIRKGDGDGKRSNDASGHAIVAPKKRKTTATSNLNVIPTLSSMKLDPDANIESPTKRKGISGSSITENAMTEYEYVYRTTEQDLQTNSENESTDFTNNNWEMTGADDDYNDFHDDYNQAANFEVQIASDEDEDELPLSVLKGRKKESFECDKCPNYFSTRRVFERHYMMKHIAITSTSSFWCRFCSLDEPFQSSNEFMEHLKTHLDNHEATQKGLKESKDEINRLLAPFACIVCSTELPTMNGFFQHCRSKHAEMLKPFKCKICKNLSFKKAVLLSDHYIRKHETPDGIKPKGTPCDVCGKLFAHPFDMKRHLRIHDVEELEGASTIVKNETTQSLILPVIKSRRKGFECTKCKKIFSRADSLLRHTSKKQCPVIKIEMGSSEETAVESISPKKRRTLGSSFLYNCTDCDETFNLQHLMESHIIEVHGHLPYSCPICTKHFKMKKHLNDHINAVHGGDRILCSECGSSFARKSDYRVHFKSKHTSFGETYIRPTLFCSICSHPFKRSGDLHRHEETHDGTQYKFQCLDCGQAFTRQNALNRHRLLHTGEKPHCCEHCGQMFRALNTWRGHMKTHDPDYLREKALKRQARKGLRKRRKKKKEIIVIDGYGEKEGQVVSIPVLSAIPQVVVEESPECPLDNSKDLSPNKAKQDEVMQSIELPKTNVQNTLEVVTT